jgi:hypothetical protein
MKTFTHRFVDVMPDKLEPNVIYVSLRFSLVSHLCACGCGEEIVTPLSPKDWQLIFNGETISLYPSIGNWRLACRSHYWIEQNRAAWAPKYQAPVPDDSADEFPTTTFGAVPKLSITDRLWARLKRRW